MSKRRTKDKSIILNHKAEMEKHLKARFSLTIIDTDQTNFYLIKGTFFQRIGSLSSQIRQDGIDPFALYLKLEKQLINTKLETLRILFKRLIQAATDKNDKDLALVKEKILFVSADSKKSTKLIEIATSEKYKEKDNDFVNKLLHHYTKNYEKPHRSFLLTCIRKSNSSSSITDQTGNTNTSHISARTTRSNYLSRILTRSHNHATQDSAKART